MAGFEHVWLPAKSQTDSDTTRINKPACKTRRQNEQTKTTHLKSANMDMKWERRNRTRVGEIWREQAGLWWERNRLIWPHPPCNGQSIHGLLREERQPEERDRTVDTSNQRQTDDMTLLLARSHNSSMTECQSVFYLSPSLRFLKAQSHIMNRKQNFLSDHWKTVWPLRKQRTRHKAPKINLLTLICSQRKLPSFLMSSCHIDGYF